MADDFDAFAHKLDRVKQQISGGNLRRITEKVGAKSKAAVPPAFSPSGLSHWGRGAKRGGSSILARYDLKSDHEVVVAPLPKPLATLLEKGSYKAGTTWKAPRRRGSARRKKGMVGTYTHARVPARRSWSNAVHQFEPKVPAWVHDEIRRILGEVF